MQRVAALFLPDWPIERLRRAERTAAPPEPPRAPLLTAEPRNGGWRPGARWARQDAPRLIAWSGTGGVPLVTSIKIGSRLEIAAACSHAQALGLAPGMAISQARAQVRGLDIRPADLEGDGEALRRLAVTLARRWCPSVTRDGDDGLLLDITGTAHLFGGEAAMARRLIAMLGRFGHQARVAIADTAGAAHALARYGPGGICPAGEHETALAPLPLAGLRIEERAIELLGRLGVRTIGQLAAMPRAPLARRFGMALVRRLGQALGELPEPIDSLIPQEAILATQRFAEPIATPEAIAHWLESLVPRIAEALAGEGLGATRIELVADRIDGVPQRIRVGLARANRDPAHLLRLLTRRIEQIEPGFGIDALTLHIRRADALGPQPVVERLDEEAAPDLAPLIDTLATRIGIAALWRSGPVESDVPERSVTRIAVLDPPVRGGTKGKADDIRQLDRSPALHPWHPEWPKPARLLRRPEPLDHVVAELPDHAPRRFTWRGRSHRVVRADGPERIHGEWWKRDAERDSVRDYFRVEDDGGCRYWLFRKGDGEQAASGDLSWYLHGVFG